MSKQEHNRKATPAAADRGGKAVPPSPQAIEDIAEVRPAATADASIAPADLTALPTSTSETPEIPGAPIESVAAIAPPAGIHELVERHLPGGMVVSEQPDGSVAVHLPSHSQGIVWFRAIDGALHALDEGLRVWKTWTGGNA